jgi:hypothetical protein
LQVGWQAQTIGAKAICHVADGPSPASSKRLAFPQIARRPQPQKKVMAFLAHLKIKIRLQAQGLSHGHQKLVCDA